MFNFLNRGGDRRQDDQVETGRDDEVETGRDDEVETGRDDEVETGHDDQEHEGYGGGDTDTIGNPFEGAANDDSARAEIERLTGEIEVLRSQVPGEGEQIVSDEIAAKGEKFDDLNALYTQVSGKLNTLMDGDAIHGHKLFMRDGQPVFGNDGQPVLEKASLILADKSEVEALKADSAKLAKEQAKRITTGKAFGQGRTDTFVGKFGRVIGTGVLLTGVVAAAAFSPSIIIAGAGVGAVVGVVQSKLAGNKLLSLNTLGYASRGALATGTTAAVMCLLGAPEMPLYGTETDLIVFTGAVAGGVHAAISTTLNSLWNVATLNFSESVRNSPLSSRWLSNVFYGVVAGGATFGLLGAFASSASDFAGTTLGTFAETVKEGFGNITGAHQNFVLERIVESGREVANHTASLDTEIITAARDNLLHAWDVSTGFIGQQWTQHVAPLYAPSLG